MPGMTYQTTDVFTPAKPASLSFVPRSSVAGQLERALLTPGKQIVIFGHSGSGKTTLITNAIAASPWSAIITRCTKDSTFESIVLSAFDKLDPYYTSENARKNSSSVTGKLEANYQVIKTSIESVINSETSEKSTRALPPQLTAERLAELCGAAGCCWIVEDFHKVSDENKQKLAQSMKVFMDTAAEYPAVKVIAIGAVDTAREVVAHDPEMNTRVAEILVPLLTQDELAEILAKGEALLNVRFGVLKQQIATYASGLGAVCHQLALNICLTAGIRSTSEQEIWITSEHLKEALNGYVTDTSDTLKAVFGKALKRKRERKFDNTNLILKALTVAGEAGAAYADLLRTIQSETPDYPQGNLTIYLRELETLDRGEIIRHDPASNRYYFNDPLFLAYAQCLFIPPQDAQRIGMRVLGLDFVVDIEELHRLRIMAETE